MVGGRLPVFTVSREIMGDRWTAVFAGAEQLAVCDTPEQADRVCELLNEAVSEVRQNSGPADR